MRSTRAYRRPRSWSVMCAVLACLLPLSRARAQTTAPAATTPTTPVADRLDRLVDRVWIVESGPDLAAGTRYVFFGNQVFVAATEGAASQVGTWAEDVDGLVVTQGKTTSRVRIRELTPERLRLRVATARTEAEITFTAAVRPPAPPPVPTTAVQPAAPVVPVGAPYRCGADAFRVSFEGEKAYVTWPDNSSVVLTEVKTADSSSSRRTYSDGQIRVVEDTSEAFTRVLFARPGFRPRPCSPAR